MRKGSYSLVGHEIAVLVKLFIYAESEWEEGQRQGASMAG